MTAGTFQLQLYTVMWPGYINDRPAGRLIAGWTISGAETVWLCDSVNAADWPRWPCRRRLQHSSDWPRLSERSWSWSCRPLTFWILGCDDTAVTTTTLTVTVDSQHWTLAIFALGNTSWRQAVLLSNTATVRYGYVSRVVATAPVWREMDMYRDPVAECGQYYGTVERRRRGDVDRYRRHCLSLGSGLLPRTGYRQRYTASQVRDAPVYW